MVEGELTVESVAMFASSILCVIFLVACIVCLYCADRFYKVGSTPHGREVAPHPTSARFNDTESESTDDIKIQSRSPSQRTTSLSRKLKVIIEHQEDRNSPIAEL